MAENDGQYGNRVARLETQVGHLEESVQVIHRKVDSGFHDLAQQISQQANSNRITWPLIFTAIGTIVSVLVVAAMVMGMALEPMRKHMELDGHPKAIENAIRDEEKLKQHKEELNYHSKKLDEMEHLVHNNNNLKERVARLEEREKLRYGD